MGLFILISTFGSYAQSNPQKAIETLRLPAIYTVTDGKVINESVSRSIIITEFVNEYDYVSREKVNGKWVTTYPENEYTLQIQETRTPTARTYMPNWCSMIMLQNGMKLNPDNPLQGHRPFNVLPKSQLFPNGGWIGEGWVQISSDASTVEMYGTLGANNNVMRIGLKDIYGKTIPGTPVYNQGANPTAMNTNMDNPPVDIMIIRNRKMKDGKTYYAPRPERGYILKNDLLRILNMSEDQLQWEVRTTMYTANVNPLTHITSTSADIEWTGTTGKLVVYYNGYDISQKSPSGKITSYGKTYPGTIYQIRVFNGIVNDQVYGSTLTLRFTKDEAKTFKLVPGNAFNYNSSTKTITYNQAEPIEIWGLGIESPENGKTWQCEYFGVGNGSGNIVPKYSYQFY